MESLDINPANYANGRTLQPIRRFRIGMMGQPAVENDHHGIVSYGIRRCEFDAFLLERVRSPKQLATPVKSIVRNNGHWVVNNQWQAPLLIGAGGTSARLPDSWALAPVNTKQWSPPRKWSLR